jgi:hypothetical protein
MLLGDFEDLLAFFEIALVIVANLGDDIGIGIVRDANAINSHFAGHRSPSECPITIVTSSPEILLFQWRRRRRS